ncbi:UPF0236 family transposase-like protein [Erysipelothrix aquatica]|uniref:UPF0236 family transposase-like protein n=1 Tax=Erysipelothrix aquatica TaxID=2683714 RepID=UPI00135CDA90
MTNKHHIMGMREMFWETVSDTLHECYDVQKIKKIYFIGDGTPWIRKSKKFMSLENTRSKFLLDKFHFKRALNRITKDKHIQATLQENILEGQDESFDRLIDVIRSNNPERLDSINQQVKYLKNQQRGIRQAYKHNVRCSMESSISHTLASNFTRNSKVYAQDNLEIYVNHRMNHLNGYNLKTYTCKVFRS